MVMSHISVTITPRAFLRFAFLLILAGAAWTISAMPGASGYHVAGHFGTAGKGFDRFYLAVPAHGNDLAEIGIYTAQD